jgi:hypothetical protein
VYCSIVLLSIAGWYYIGRIMALNDVTEGQVVAFRDVCKDAVQRSAESKTQRTQGPSQPTKVDDGLEAPDELGV